MSIEVKVPGLPESVSDATVVAWRKQVGETVQRDEALVDLETDKVVLEVPSPTDGIIEKIHQQEGAVVTAEQLLASIKPVEESLHLENDAAESVADSQDEKIITPSAKKMMQEHGIAERQVSGSGKGGRVLKEDVQAYIEKRDAQDSGVQAANKGNTRLASSETVKQPERVQQAGTQSAAIQKVDASLSAEERIEKRVPMTRLRARIAERLLEAQQNAAILTTFNEVNMQPVMDLRKKYQDLFVKKYDVKLGFMSFFVKASIEALKRFPAVNASIDGNDIVYHGFFDIGVAIASPRGLVVPVLRDADQMSLAEIERGIAEFVDRAKNNQLTIDDMTGGTFSLTNGGVFGSMLSTPIINPPQSGILGMHKIQDRAMVENGEVVVQPTMYLALSYDHRIIDGAEAVQFLVTIKDVLEDPARMLVGV